MRFVIELVLIAAFVAFAWEKSLKERVSKIPWIANKISETQSHPQSSTSNSHPTPTVSGAWMWDSNRKTVLDRPSPTPRLHDNR
jgi:hypothetical protein